MYIMNLKRLGLGFVTIETKKDYLNQNLPNELISDNLPYIK